MDDYLGYVIVQIVLLLGGLTVQSFIVALNLIDRIKRKLMTATDLIITSLGISRFIFHFVSFWEILQAMVFNTIPVIVSITMSYIARLSAYSSIGLSVLLCAFLCLKISNFHNVFFLGLQVMISQKVVHVIVLSLLLSWFFSSFFFMAFYNGTYNNSTKASAFIHGISRPEVIGFLLYLWNFSCILIYVLSSVLIIVSLCCHMIRMKTNRSVSSTTGIYVKTLTFVIVSFLTFIIFVIIVTAPFEGDLTSNLKNLRLKIGCQVFHLLNSVFIIVATTKLRNQLFKILRSQTKCRRGEPDSGDPVVTIH